LAALKGSSSGGGGCKFSGQQRLSPSEFLQACHFHFGCLPDRGDWNPSPTDYWKHNLRKSRCSQRYRAQRRPVFWLRLEQTIKPDCNAIIRSTTVSIHLHQYPHRCAERKIPKGGMPWCERRPHIIQPRTSVAIESIAGRPSSTKHRRSRTSSGRFTETRCQGMF
jgi:hypothetical protein